MANVNAPFGLRWLGLNNSPSTPSDPIINGTIVAGSTQAAYNGDVMIRTATTGNVVATTGALGAVLAGNIVGVFQGCSYLSNASGRREFSKTWPGGALVANGTIAAQMTPLEGVTPGLFVIQSSGASPFTLANIGENCDIAYAVGTVLSTGYSKSGVTLNFATLAATATLPFRVRGLWSQIAGRGQPGTDDTTPFNWVIVSYNGFAQAGLV